MGRKNVKSSSGDMSIYHPYLRSLVGQTVRYAEYVYLKVKGKKVLSRIIIKEKVL